MTLRAAQQALTDQLKTLYDEREAANITDWVLAYVTGKKKIDRLLIKNDPLSDEWEEQLQKIARELSGHRPIQYVLNEAWFAGMKFYVDEQVLIPRPETEELVNWIAETISPGGSLRILDIGTGSGCIPISLGKRLPGASVSGIDVSEGALRVAKKNTLSLNADIDFICLDFLQQKEWPRLPVFDIIVSNPPYIRAAESVSMHKNVLEHEPAIALFVPDNDPLVFYRNIAVFAQDHLAAGGNIFMEINEALGAVTADIFRQAGYQTELRKDMQGKDRMLRAFGE